MSTRCNIVITDKKNNNSVMLYHHHDGYPEGVGVELLEELEGKHFYSAEYLATHLMKFDEPMYKECHKEHYNEFELTSGMHGDIEYIYDIDLYSADKVSITCWKAETDDNGDKVRGEVINIEIARYVGQVFTVLAKAEVAYLEKFRVAADNHSIDHLCEVAVKYVPQEKWCEMFHAELVK